MLGIWTVIFSLLGTAKGYNVLYPGIKGLAVHAPFGGTTERPLLLFPLWTKVRLLLYTRNNTDFYEELSTTDPAAITSSNFSTAKNSVFLVHGFTQNGEMDWIIEMCQTIVEADDVNCIIVDWGSASWIAFAQASNAIRVVGAILASFLDMLKEEYSYSSSKVHLIGHNVGGHAVGYTGSMHQGIGRITALDPTGLNFDDLPDEVRLDKSDALCVECIHTDGTTLGQLGLGTMQECGHFDYYPNGGKKMPECQNVSLDLLTAACIVTPIIGPIKCSESEKELAALCASILKDYNMTLDEIIDLIKKLACNNFMSVKYFVESIKDPTKYISYPCDNIETIDSVTDGVTSLGSIVTDLQTCITCPTEGCPKMGYFSNICAKIPTSNQKFYVNTIIQ